MEELQGQQGQAMSLVPESFFELPWPLCSRRAWSRGRLRLERRADNTHVQTQSTPLCAPSFTPFLQLLGPFSSPPHLMS